MNLGVSTLQARVQRQEMSTRARFVQNIQLLDDYSFRLFDENGELTKTYKPCKTGLAFHQSNDFVRLILGPFGSGKSTTNMAEIVIRACKMPRCIDGVRRIKVAVIRNTSGELETSTLATWDAWFSDLGEVHQRKKPVLIREHIFNDGNGRIELMLVFLSCDRPDDMKKLKSTEFTLAYLNEANELPRGLIDFIKGRVNGRYPAVTMCAEKYFTGVLMDTNPPNTDHELYNIFEVKKPLSYRIFKQPPGLLDDPDNVGKFVRNPNADNAENLRDDYYTKMAEGADPEFIKVYCKGEYGLIRKGKPVYPQYNDELHSVESIELTPDNAIYLGWDFGNTPACLVSQYIGGQWRAIKEFVSDFGQSVQTLAEAHVKPWLDQYCLGYAIYSYHDPSDPKASSTYIAPSQTLEAAGIYSEPASSNLLQPRLDAMKHFLGRLVNGDSAFKVSRSGCPVFRKGLYGEYVYKLVHSYGETVPKEEPHKSHPISDIQDCAHYTALALYQPTANIVDASVWLEPVRHQGGLV